MADHPTNPEIDFLAGEFYAADPHRHWRWCREHAPVYYDAPNEVWGITLHEDIMWIEPRPQLFSNAQGIRPDSGPLPMMISMDAPDHVRRRKLVNQGFTPRQVSRLEPSLRETVHALLDEVAERGECDFIWDLACWLPLIVIGDMMGLPPEERLTLLRWSDDLMRGTTATDPAAFEKAGQAFAEWSEFILGVVADRREEPRDDLISTFVHAEVDGSRLSDDELVNETLLILIGGDETTRHVISGGVYELLRDPAQRRDLADDRTLLPGAVEEMLRWVTPIKNMSRYVTDDVELRGQQLRAGDQLLLFYPSANRDERVFTDPDRFDIRRDPNPHVAFGGHGPHYCLGHNLARLEITVFLDCLLDRIGDLRLATADPLPVRPANFVSGFEAMPVEFTPVPRRSPAPTH